MQKIISCKDFSITHKGDVLVDSLNFSVEAGKTLGIVGESGSGKSLTSLAIMGLLPENLQTSGAVYFKDTNVLDLDSDERRQLRGKRIAMIFQEPMTALNPSMTCGKQLAEILELHENLSKTAVKEQVIKLFDQVKIPRPEQIYNSYPHQISGGQKQRVMIAMAMATKPDILIADEPTTALDVTVQAEVLNLLKQIQESHGMAMIFITHDLGVVKEIADEVLVLYKGKMKEYGTAKEVFNNPKDAYTKGLLACRPTAHTAYERLPLVADFVEQEKATSFKVTTEAERISASKALMVEKPMLEIKNVKRWFTDGGSFLSKANVVKAVNEVSLEIYPGETLGLVGESGCGKTTLGRILCGLEKADAGEVFYHQKDISKLNTKEWRLLHKNIQIIFQDPFSSLNPRIKVGDAIAEVARVHKVTLEGSLREHIENLLVRVGLQKEHYKRYPHEFSGGQRQRIGIARALVLNPKFIVCDESVSALDVSVQAQIINLLNDLKRDFQFTYLFISHDLAVVKYISNRIAVMKEGSLVETGFADEVYQHPKDVYTQKLIASVPKV